MSREKVWWVVTWDVPTFAGSPGCLVYREVVKARHPQIALWKACDRFVGKMRWALNNRWKSIGGEETEAQLLIGGTKQAGHWVGSRANVLMNEYQHERSQPYSDGYSEAAAVLEGLGFTIEQVKPNSLLLQRLTQSTCEHKKTIRSIKVLSHSAALKVELCRNCDAKRICGWYQEGEVWL